jgi:hypothetical protein
MARTTLNFSKQYGIHFIFSSFIVRLIRYEIVTNLNNYSHKVGLKQFVEDMDRYSWLHIDPVINCGRFCGDAASYAEFVKCLNRVRELILGFGLEIGDEWKAKLKIDEDDVVSLPKKDSVSNILYWFDCFRQAVEEYKPNIGTTIFPPPPD